ncbi:MAG: hypothetical protein AB7F39_02225 [Variibacter sp.]
MSLKALETRDGTRLSDEFNLHAGLLLDIRLYRVQRVDESPSPGLDNDRFLSLGGLTEHELRRKGN